MFTNALARKIANLAMNPLIFPFFDYPLYLEVGTDTVNR